jgi:hypothetical protein
MVQILIKIGLLIYDIVQEIINKYNLSKFYIHELQQRIILDIHDIIR